jgi:nucleotide-binding universal stress UspA family protein
MAGEIVVGVGGDGSGFQAARTAARVATLMRTPLVIVFAYESVAMGPRGGALEDEISEVGRHATGEIHDELAATYPNLTIDVQLVHQRPVEALIEVAAARCAEAIAVGHGGRGLVRAALLGSITYEIVHRSPIPVLVVPDDEDDLED